MSTQSREDHDLHSDHRLLEMQEAFPFPAGDFEATTAAKMTEYKCMTRTSWLSPTIPPFGLSNATDFPNAIPNVMSVQVMILDVSCFLSVAVHRFQTKRHTSSSASARDA